MRPAVTTRRPLNWNRRRKIKLSALRPELTAQSLRANCWRPTLRDPTPPELFEAVLSCKDCSAEIDATGVLSKGAN